MKKQKFFVPIIIYLLTSVSVCAEEARGAPKIPKKLTCAMAWNEASRLYTYINSLRVEMAEDIKKAHDSQMEEYQAEIMVRKEVSLEGFNLDLLAIEKIDMTVFVQGDFTKPWGEMRFRTRRAPAIMAIRDRINASLIHGTAIEKNEYLPHFQYTQKQFINLMVYKKCRNNSKYFFSKVYVRDDGKRDDDIPDIYKPWPNLGFLGKLIGQ